MQSDRPPHLPSSPAQPLLISSRNCEAFVGLGWAWCLRFARAHGVPVYRVGSRKRVIDAGLLLAAIRAQNEGAAASEAGTPAERAAMRRRLGLELAR